MTQKVADVIANALYAYGFRHAYGIHGANSEDLFAALLRAPAGRRLTVTIAKHEFGAGAMADGSARMTGRPGCLIATSGGAAMNCVPALAEAHQSRSPVLALIGSPPTAAEGRGAFQDMCAAPRTVDALAVLRGVTGFAAKVSVPEDLAPALDGALAALEQGLPAALLLPKDVQLAEHSGSVNRAPAPPGPEAPSDEVIRLVRASRRPLILLGEAASRAGLAGPVAELAAATGAVVAVGPNGRDAAPRTGVVGVAGVMGHPSVPRVAAEADLILTLGTDLDLMDRSGLDAALDVTCAVHVAAEPPLREVTIHESARDLTAYTRALAGAAGARRRTPWTDTAPVPITVPRNDSGLMTCADAVDALAAAIPGDALVFADAGNAGAAAVHRLPLGTGTRFLVALGMGGMGFGIAAGIGAAIATGRPTVILAGDGAFFMHGMEIHTAIEADAPVLLVVLNNDAHAMCVAREEKFFPDLTSINRFRPSRIADGLAAMFPTLPVRSVTTPDGARSAAAALLSGPGRGPSCLEIATDPTEIPPFTALLPDTAKERS
ncbi:thiamine pyrophosphate-binding protein [Tsukamurella paurometabola]|uniref:acetolactate synthase n=1 Tax=Tsukamurella paurometabola TaxID=2061 RepID=A0A3P8KUQ9_TSUPA|nr:thiamine pyrophosphate-binding protein [Tsukamurella paurometabola]UEA83671.1 thiamine pyrophosphate-dependent enzyme [Tsukamurella paurometabola]VDR40807.1 Acetolactate synthase large subunit [Tsukamurella paurometabola]